MPLPATKPITPAEYLAAERAAEQKHELVDGVVYAMSGGSRWHALIVSNIVGELRDRLRERDCDAVSSDLRVRIPQLEAYVYPDVVVYCEGGEWLDQSFDTLENPVLIIEVLSPSTEAYDRGLKFHKYREIESLQAYVLVTQERPLVETYLRRAEGEWAYIAYTHIENALELPSLGVSIPLSEIYYRVSFQVEPSGEQ